MSSSSGSSSRRCGNPKKIHTPAKLHQAKCRKCLRAECICPALGAVVTRYRAADMLAVAADDLSARAIRRAERRMAYLDLATIVGHRRATEMTGAV
jgi:hypothetical protein